LKQKCNNHYRKKTPSRAWWCTYIIPALKRLEQEDCEFQSSPGYIVRLQLKNKKPTKIKKGQYQTWLIFYFIPTIFE
jgi:hypothetical protein